MNLHKLIALDISNNNLNTITKGIFYNVTHLLLFVLTGNPLKKIASDMFYGINIGIIHSNNFCWLVRGSLFIECGCTTLGKGWRGDLGTFR